MLLERKLEKHRLMSKSLNHGVLCNLVDNKLFLASSQKTSDFRNNKEFLLERICRIGIGLGLGIGIGIGGYRYI